MQTIRAIETIKRYLDSVAVVSLAYVYSTTADIDRLVETLQREVTA
jgi:hypothetical protein